MFRSLTIVNMKRESPVVKNFTPVTFSDRNEITVDWFKALDIKIQTNKDFDKRRLHVLGL